MNTREKIDELKETIEEMKIRQAAIMLCTQKVVDDANKMRDALVCARSVMRTLLPVIEGVDPDGIGSRLGECLDHINEVIREVSL